MNSFPLHSCKHIFDQLYVLQISTWLFDPHKLITSYLKPISPQSLTTCFDEGLTLETSDTHEESHSG